MLEAHATLSCFTHRVPFKVAGSQCPTCVNPEPHCVICCAGEMQRVLQVPLRDFLAAARAAGRELELAKLRGER